MASSFSFGFGGDDIDDDIESNHGVADALQNKDLAAAHPPAEALAFNEAKQHGIDELLSTLPSQLTYNTLPIEGSSDSEASLLIPRRDLFDIRAQLMAEDDMESNDNDKLISGLEKGDITPAVYEGGFKSWECAIDLARFCSYSEYARSLFNGESKAEGDVNIVELGAGTAIPSLALLRSFLLEPIGDHTPKRQITFIFADYNRTVLDLVTVPNILLTWYAACEDDQFATKSNLDIDPGVLVSFRRSLSARGIHLHFISGGWSPKFVELCMSSFPKGEAELEQKPNGTRTLILASETIYSPSSLYSFTETLVTLLRRASQSSFDGPIDGAQYNGHARALIAAKKVYFGVGGGVDEFIAKLREIPQDATTSELVDIEDEGVGRTILEVQLNM